MNKVTRLFMVALTAAGLAVPAAAQTAAGGTYFRPHWTVGVQGGVQYTCGEAKFSKLLSPNVQLSLGYQPLSWLGLRLGANAWQSKGGFSSTQNGLGHGPVYKWNYVSPMLDVMFSLPNIFLGYDASRRYDVQAFLGGGANIAWSNEEAQNLSTQGYELSKRWDGTKVLPVGRLGLAVDYWVTDHVALGLEGNWNVLSDRYNSKRGENPDMYTNVLAGVKIALGKRSKTVVAPVKPVVREEPEAKPVMEKPVAVEPEPKPAVVEKKPEPVVETAAVAEVAQSAAETPDEHLIHFRINRSDINAGNKSEAQAALDWLKANPEGMIIVKGYADTATGNNRVNLRIAKQRSRKTAQWLIAQGISPSRIHVSWRLRPQRENGQRQENRVTVITISK